MENWIWAVIGPTVGGLLWFALRWMGRHVAALIVAELDDQLHLDQMRESIDEIRAEVTVNSGGSLKDRVLEVERKVDALR
jgi:hypothetical protein